MRGCPALLSRTTLYGSTGQGSLRPDCTALRSPSEREVAGICGPCLPNSRLFLAYAALPSLTACPTLAWPYGRATIALVSCAEWSESHTSSLMLRSSVVVLLYLGIKRPNKSWKSKSSYLYSFLLLGFFSFSIGC